MNHHEQVPEFSRKDQEFLQEIADKFGPKSLEYKQFLKALEQDKAAKNLGLANVKEKEKPLLGLVKNVISQIEAVKLSKPNKKSSKILQKQKEEARKEIRSLLSAAQRYVEAIDKVQQAGYGKSNMDIKDYQKIYEESDANRRRAHNALFDQAALVSRYVIFHFGELSKAQLEKFEDQEDEAGREVLNVERVKFPKNLLWPERVNLNKRESVGEWALLISKELAGEALENL